MKQKILNRLFVSVAAMMIMVSCGNGTDTQVCQGDSLEGENDNNLVETDSYDISEFANAFFADDATWSYKNFLGKTHFDLYDNPIGNSTKVDYDNQYQYYTGKKINVTGEFNIFGVIFYPEKLSGDVYFESPNGDPLVNFDAEIDAIEYEIKEGALDMDSRIIGALKHWLEKNYKLTQVRFDDFEYVGKSSSNTYFQIAEAGEGAYFTITIMNKAYFDRYN